MLNFAKNNKKAIIITFIVVICIILIHKFKILSFGSGNARAIMQEAPKELRLLPAGKHIPGIGLPRPEWPNAEVLYPNAPFIHRLRVFLTSDECKHIIEQCAGEFHRSSVSDVSDGKPKQDNIRTSTSCFLKRAQTTVIADIEKRAAATFGIPQSHIEPLQIVRYHAGEKFDAHHDFFHHTRGPNGQRYGTILVYLNDNFEGGKTSFPRCGVDITPITGDGIFWYNSWLNKKGLCFCFEDSLHQGNPPATGVKYALNIWVRFDPY